MFDNCFDTVRVEVEIVPFLVLSCTVVDLNFVFDFALCLITVFIL